MIKYLLIPLGPMFTASAQIVLKKASSYSNWTKEWIFFILLSSLFYGVSFFIYMNLLRMYPISKIYPLLTVITIALITIYGIIIGEAFPIRHIAGIALGAGAIYLLLS